MQWRRDCGPTMPFVNLPSLHPRLPSHARPVQAGAVAAASPAQGKLPGRPSPSLAKTRAWMPWSGLLALWLLGLLSMAGAPSWAAAPAPAMDVRDLAGPVRELAMQALGAKAGAASTPRVEIEIGRLDPRLKLAACERIVPSLPSGGRLWGPSRVALHCASGPVAWRTWLPVVLRVFGPGLAATQALPEGTLLMTHHLQSVEVEYSAGAAPVLAPPDSVLGRALARPLGAGQALREGDVRQRVWFQGGDTVQLIARGDGYSVASEGRAETAGIEGRPVRVRTETGKMVEGRAVGPRRVEVML